VWWICLYNLLENFLLLLAMKKFRRSVNICHSYCQKQSATFNGTQCIIFNLCYLWFSCITVFCIFIWCLSVLKAINIIQMRHTKCEAWEWLTSNRDELLLQLLLLMIITLTWDKKAKHSYAANPYITQVEYYTQCTVIFNFIHRIGRCNENTIKQKQRKILN